MRIAEELADSLEPESEGSDFLGNMNIECYGCHERGHVARNCPQKQERTPLRKPATAGGVPGRLCMFCGEKGHFAVDCSRMVSFLTECAFCGIRGHSDEECYKKKRILGQLAAAANEQNGQANPSGTPAGPSSGPPRQTVGLVDDEPLAIEDGPCEGDGLIPYPVTAVHSPRAFLTVKVLLSGCQRQLVIDTGAAISVLSSPIPGVRVMPCKIGVWGADGKPLELLGSQELQVRIAGLSLLHRFYVLGTSKSGLDLLGIDLLERLPITIRADRRQAVVKHLKTGIEAVVSTLMALPTAWLTPRVPSEKAFETNDSEKAVETNIFQKAFETNDLEKAVETNVFQSAFGTNNLEKAVETNVFQKAFETND